MHCGKGQILRPRCGRKLRKKLRGQIIRHSCLVLVYTRIGFRAFFQVAKAISHVRTERHHSWLPTIAGFGFFCRFCLPPPLFCQRYLLKCESILQATEISIKTYPCWLNQCIRSIFLGPLSKQGIHLSKPLWDPEFLESRPICTCECQCELCLL